MYVYYMYVYYMYVVAASEYYMHVYFLVRFYLKYHKCSCLQKWNDTVQKTERTLLIKVKKMFFYEAGIV